MVTIASSMLRDSIYGMVYRVTVGAVLSTIDAATDIYVITTYYQSDDLVSQANALLAMITLNIVFQLIFVLAQYKKKGWRGKVKEVLISIFFLCPAFDAYRVSTNHVDADASTDPLIEMVANKSLELSTESIPGCVLQIYVWLIDREGAGTFALFSIAASALTTGYTSALIEFDMVSKRGGEVVRQRRRDGAATRVLRKDYKITNPPFFFLGRQSAAS